MSKYSKWDKHWFRFLKHFKGKHCSGHIPMSQWRVAVTSAMHPSRWPVRTGKKELVAGNYSKMKYDVARKDVCLKKKKKKYFLSKLNRYLHCKRKTSFFLLVSWFLLSWQYQKVHKHWKNPLSLWRETEAKNSKEPFSLLYEDFWGTFLQDLGIRKT